jgi:hypothetical protein
MFYFNKLTDDDNPIPLVHRCRPERLGKDMTGLELHEFGLSLFTSYFSDQGGKLVAVNMNPENGTPHVIIENPQKVLLYVWVKTDLAPNIPVYVPNETHDVITELSRKYKAIPSFASISISCASPGENLVPKCGGEYYVVLNEFEEI